MVYIFPFYCLGLSCYTNGMKIVETSRPEEIRSIMKDALENNKEFMIWQRDKNNHILFQVTARLIQVHKGDIYQFNLSKEIHVRQDLPVFFAVVDSTLVFKTGKVQSAKNLLLLNTPDEVKYKERRKYPRKSFKYQDKKHVEVQYSPKDEGQNEIPKFQSEIVDISEGGICIVVTKEAYEKLDTTKPLSLKSLSSDIQLGSEFAQIMNSRPYKGPTLSRGNILAIGLMFVLKTPETEE